MDAHILQRLDKHVLEAHRRLCQSVDGATFEQAEDWARGDTGSDIAAFNLLLLLNHRALTDDLLSDAAAYFNDRGIPHVVAFDEHWFRGGANFLHSRWYQPLPPQPGMVLLGIPRQLPSHPSLVIETVRTAVELADFCNLVSTMFGLSIIETVRLFPINQVSDSAIRHYVGYIDEVPVAAATAVLAGDVVSVWNVVTQDDARRQGVATTLVSHLLSDACDDGCDLSMLYSSPMAFSLYQRLGYELYTQRRGFLLPGA